jgi:hypothetical protein
MVGECKSPDDDLIRPKVMFSTDLVSKLLMLHQLTAYVLSAVPFMRR